MKCYECVEHNGLYMRQFFFNGTLKKEENEINATFSFF